MWPNLSYVTKGCPFGVALTHGEALVMNLVLVVASVRRGRPASFLAGFLTPRLIHLLSNNPFAIPIEMPETGIT